MTQVLTLPGTWESAFDHLAAYGAAAIAESSGWRVRISWDDRESRLQLFGIGWDDLSRCIHEHAGAHAEGSWLQESSPIKAGGGPKALFSPRVWTEKVKVVEGGKQFERLMDDRDRREWWDRREQSLDNLSDGLCSLDLFMIGALGAPSYWNRDKKGQLLTDYGASRWEMKPRNQGQEFVGDRLRNLATVVSNRTIEVIAAGLKGEVPVVDEIKSGVVSRTPTGLMPPQTTDNARAWCALWGISVFNVAQSAGWQVSQTSCHAGSHGSGYFFLPVMIRPWPVDRLRTVLRSSHLRAVAEEKSRDAPVASQWLKDRGVSFVVNFPVHRGGSASAPERWAEYGHRVFLAT